MVVIKALFVFALFSTSLLVACTATRNSNADGAPFCNISRTEVYDLNTDPTVDFNVLNLEKTVSFNNTDCPQVDNEAFTVFVSQVKRTGDIINIEENQFSGGGFFLDMTVSGTTLLPVENNFTINGCTVKRFWTGTIDSGNNSLNVIQDISYIGNCRPVFYDPDNDLS